jgi:hypothetical protein
LVEPSIRFAAGVASRSRSRRRGPSCHTGKIHAEWPGLRHVNMIKTGERSYCIIAEWNDMGSHLGQLLHRR